MIKVHLGSDHAGYEMKDYLKEQLADSGYEVEDHGTFSSASVDYPDYAHEVAKSVEAEFNSIGVLVCGSANGVAMAANKHQGIRAAICWKEEISRLARQHNNANIICIPARFVSKEEAKMMVSVFLDTPFEGGRHEGRVSKITCI